MAVGSAFARRTRAGEQCELRDARTLIPGALLDARRARERDLVAGARTQQGQRVGSRGRPVAVDVAHTCVATLERNRGAEHEQRVTRGRRAPGRGGLAADRRRVAYGTGEEERNGANCGREGPE